MDVLFSLPACLFVIGLTGAWLNARRHEAWFWSWYSSPGRVTEELPALIVPCVEHSSGA
ncbi:MAG: hypothetical protein HY092_04200 [Candidatus Kerfeldbacteria bacterium]|nr:hypothetical protein [Candidatus Kerfeldbacteria bacterium]